jgi:hypothetical protein
MGHPAQYQDLTIGQPDVRQLPGKGIGDSRAMYVSPATILLHVRKILRRSMVEANVDCYNVSSREGVSRLR